MAWWTPLSKSLPSTPGCAWRAARARGGRHVQKRGSQANRPCFNYRLRSAVAPLVTYHLAASGAAAFPPDTPNFIFPDSCVLRRLEFEEYDGESFTFTLTDEVGGRLFGFTRRFLPVGSAPRYPDALCILSRHAWPALFHELLEHVQVRWLLQPGAAFALMEAALNAPLPRPGLHFCLAVEAASAPAAPACAVTNVKREQLVLARAEDSCSSSWPLLPLSRHLSVDNLLLLLSALLCEQRIVFVSRHLSRLSACIHAAVALLQPLQWQHILVPLLPHHLLSYCSAPMPFVIGLHAEFLPELLALPGLDELIVVSLDSGRVSSSLDVHTQSRAAEPGDEIVEGRFSFPLPDEIAAKLKKQLKELKWGQSGECDEQDVFEALLTFQLQLFGHADWAAPLDPRGKFNIEGFVQTVAAVAPHNHDFFTHAMHSQCVERFMQQQCDKWRAGNGRGAANSNGGVLSPADRFERIRLEVLSAAAGSNPSAPYAELFSFSFVLKRVHAHLDAALGIVISQSALAVATAVGSSLPRFVGTAETRKLALELTSNSPLPSSRGTPRDLLSQLTLLSFDCRAFDPLMRVVWERLGDCKKKNHSHGHKALVLLQHMLEHGSDRVILHTLFAAHAQTVLQSLAYNYSNENERVQELIRASGLRVQTLLGNVFLLRRTRRYARIVDLRRYRYFGADRPRLHTEAGAADAGLLCDPDWDEFRHRSLVEMLLPALPPFKQLHARYQTEFAEPPPLRTPSSARAAAGASLPSPLTSGSHASAAPPSGQAALSSRFDFSGFSSPIDAEDPFAGPPGILAILPPEAHVPSIHDADFGFASERPGPLAILPPAELAQAAHPESQSARNTPVAVRSVAPAAAELSTPPVNFNDDIKVSRKLGRPQVVMMRQSYSKRNGLGWCNFALEHGRRRAGRPAQEAREPSDNEAGPGAAGQGHSLQARERCGRIGKGGRRAGCGQLQRGRRGRQRHGRGRRGGGRGRRGLPAH